MELVDRDLKCIFCRAMMVLLIQDQAFLRDQGFKHDLRFCRDCESRPERTGASNIDQPTAN
jgi:hypothetical protein